MLLSLHSSLPSSAHLLEHFSLVELHIGVRVTVRARVDYAVHVEVQAVDLGLGGWW